MYLLNKKGNTPIYSFILFTISLISLGLCVFIKNYNIEEETLKLLLNICTGFSIFELIAFALILKKYEKKNGSFILFFLISFFAFLMSQQALYMFSYITPAASIFSLCSLKDVTWATYYTNMYLSGVLCGVILFKSKAKNESSIYYTTEDDMKQNDSKVYKYTKIIFCISLIPAVYNIAYLFTAAQSLGYDAIFENSGNLILRITGYFKNCFVLSLFSFIILSKSHIYKTVSIVTIISVSIIYYMMGDRALPTALILSLIWIYTNYSDKTRFSSLMKSRRYLIAFTIVALLVIMFPLIQSVRGGRDGLISFQAIIDAYKSTGNSILTTICNSLGNLGFSATALIYTSHFVPANSSFRFGSTYFWAMTMIVPNFLSPLGVAHIGSQYASLARWLMSELNITWGPGFSMPAEAYINFGWFSIPIAVLTGYILAKVLSPKTENITGKFSKYHLIICIGIFITCISMPRRDLGNSIRDIVYTVLPLQVLMYSSFKKQPMLGYINKRESK